MSEKKCIKDTKKNMTIAKLRAALKKVTQSFRKNKNTKSSPGNLRPQKVILSLTILVSLFTLTTAKEDVPLRNPCVDVSGLNGEDELDFQLTKEAVKLHHTSWPDSKEEFLCWQNIRDRLYDNSQREMRQDFARKCVLDFEEAICEMVSQAIGSKMKSSEFGFDFCRSRYNILHNEGIKCVLEVFRTKKTLAKRHVIPMIVFWTIAGGIMYFVALT